MTGDTVRRYGGALFRRAPRVLILAAIGAVGGMVACGGDGQSVPSRHVVDGDPERGRAAIVAYGCGSCHSIPGIRSAHGMVGPPLDHWAQRRMIAGEVPNDLPRLITWITVPQAIEPGNGMPNMGISDGQARDIAAYLYTLH